MDRAERLTTGVKRGSQIRTARPIDRAGSRSWLFNVLHSDDVLKNSSTAATSDDGEFDTSTTTDAPSRTSASPSPVSVLTPELGDTGSWPRSLSLVTSFDPIS